MKIGVFLLDAVVTGTTALAFELADGLRLAGHEVTTFSATRSGRETVRWTRPDGGARWWMRAPDVTLALGDELDDFMSSLDFMIVNDIGSSTLDGERDRLPVYVQGLLRTTTPWTMIAHGNSYDEKHAPHFRRLVAESPGFSKQILACSAPYSYVEHPMFRDLRALPMRRPYRPQFSLESPLESRSKIGAAGRFSNGKNLHLVGLASRYIDNPHIEVELWGACQNSIRPTDAYMVYEELMNAYPTASGVPPLLKNRTSPWSIMYPEEHTVAYCGSYTEAWVVMRRFKVFVNVTDATFSSGTEYTTMEAADAGCLLLAQAAMVDDGSNLMYGRLDPISAPRLPKSAIKHTDLLMTLAERMEGAFDVDIDMMRRLALHNRHALRSEHDPVKIAQNIIKYAL